jgi:hypothetical protein
MVVLTKKQKMIAFAVVIIVVGGVIIAVIVNSKSKDPVKPATKSSGATTKPATTSSGATTKPATTSSGATTKPATTSSGATTKPSDSDSGSDNKEVYYADKDPGYAFTTRADAEKWATLLGGTIATFPQLVEAYKKGLNQCSFGWGDNGTNQGAIYTVTTKKMNDDTCRFPEGGVTQFFPEHPEWTNHAKVSRGGVWVYGVKKPKGQLKAFECANVRCVLPFSETKWSQYD